MRHPYQPAIGLATVPLDRFIALEAWQKIAPGWLITKPFTLTGNRLELNADLRSGTLRVEILDVDGNPLDGYSGEDCLPLENVDGLRLAPRWRDHADLSGLSGRAVRLKVYLQDAKLFAFQVRASAAP